MKTEISLSKGENWKERLPLAGYKIRIIFKDGRILRVPWGIIQADNTYIHINNLSYRDRINSHPIIHATDQIPADQVLKIFYREEERGEEYCLF